MEQYKQEFIEFMVASDVLKFGEFTLKSGRKSPFFMNAGAYVTGSQLMKLGEYYAKAIHDTYGLDFDVLFGPSADCCDHDRDQQVIWKRYPLLFQQKGSQGSWRYRNPAWQQAEGRR